VATVRERRDGVWEVRVFTGRDAQGRPTQVSRTVRGGKRDAQRVAEAFAERVLTRMSAGPADDASLGADRRRATKTNRLLMLVGSCAAPTVQQRRTCSRV